MILRPSDRQTQTKMWGPLIKYSMNAFRAMADHCFNTFTEVNRQITVRKLFTHTTENATVKRYIVIRFPSFPMLGYCFAWKRNNSIIQEAWLRYKAP